MNRSVEEVFAEKVYRVAEYCGWRRVSYDKSLLPGQPPDKESEPLDLWQPPTGVLAYSFLPEYMVSLEACCQFEAEAEKRGHRDDYVGELRRIVCGDYGKPLCGDWELHWLLVRATAQQRFAAICQVIERRLDRFPANSGPKEPQAVEGKG